MADAVDAIFRRIRRRCGALADLSLEHGATRRWHSLLFDGGRHDIALNLSGHRIDEALAAMQDEIALPDFAIAGHLVADIQVAAIDRGIDHARVTLNALTIES